MTIRRCALRLIEVLDECGDDVAARESDLTAAMQDLLSLPGLDEVVANPVRSPDDAVGWLYYDGDVRIVRGRMPAGMNLAPHDHGGWNLFGVYRGAVDYASYRRLDDGSEPGRCRLEPADVRVLRDGDVTILPGPPHDIHAVRGIAEESVTVLVARGGFEASRRLFHPDEGRYETFDGDGIDAAR